MEKKLGRYDHWKGEIQICTNEVKLLGEGHKNRYIN